MLRILLCLAMAVLGCRAACNVCSAGTNTTCVSETSFMFCIDQIPMDCPTSLYCMDGNRVCQSKPELAACRTDTVGSATESTTSYTDSTSSSSESTTSTTESTPSSTESTSSTTESTPSSTESTSSTTESTSSTTQSSTSTTESTSSTTQSTTSSTESSSSTTSAPTTVDPLIIDMCRSKASAGRYSNPNDTSCRSYVICFYRGSVWSGNVWKCPSTKPYFSSITSTCGTILSICV